MTKFIRKTKTKRKLTKEQEQAYNDAINAFNELAKKLKKYESDKFIADKYNILAKQLKDMELAKERYLNTPIERIITYNIDRSKLLKPMKMRISKSLLQNYIFLKNNMI